MSDWIDFDRWPECRSMERPGFIFEVANDEGRRMLTSCVVPLEIPFDWTSRPAKFRVIPEPDPRHSTPLPKPVKPD